MEAMPTPPGQHVRLTPDELLTTTRAVRKRLDLERPVDPALVEECLEVALQAPSGSNSQRWHFVVVTDAATREALAAIYRRAFEKYQTSSAAASALPTSDAGRAATQQRVMGSAEHLAAVMHRVPVHVVPCFEGRVDGAASWQQAGAWASILPAVWSFSLAARARGLGTSWTTLHLRYEREAAELLGIPYDEVTQAALIPVGHTVGTDFRPALREPLARSLHRDRW